MLTIVTMPLPDPDIVGQQEIARRLGVAEQTVRAWKLRGVLPDPDQVVSGRSLWSWSATIEPWAIETGRLRKPANN